MDAIQNRYEFVLFFDVENGNPNGDPDAGNMPRIDPETGLGIVSDVCLKRKVRNYVELAQGEKERFHIYVQEKAVLNERNLLAYQACNLKPESKKLPKKEEDAKRITQWMCQNFYDVRTFGAVMSTDVNCGQVRGAAQFCFARSVEPVVPSESTITRMAVTKTEEAEKERTMGRKFIIPYGLYRAEGFISAALAEKNGFSEEDLSVLWNALANMFDHDHSASRGKMSARRLIIFKHENKMGNAPAQSLFDCVRCTRRAENQNAPARSFSDYEITVNNPDHAGVSVENRL